MPMHSPPLTAAAAAPPHQGTGSAPGTDMAHGDNITDMRVC